MSLVPRDVSRRESEVLALVRENLTNAAIATRLYISERTVESHVSSLLRKFGARDRHELGRRASEAGSAALLSSDTAVSGLPAVLQLRADASTFVGRQAERQLLRDHWNMACAGPARLVLLTGEAGIGKSRLASELAVEVHAGGGRVLLGACYEDADDPYDPFVQIIAADAAALGQVEVARRLVDDQGTLIRLSPGIERGSRGSHRVATAVGVLERGLVLDAIERWIVASGSNAPLLLVVEDLHWSTSSTRHVVRHLVRRAMRGRLLIVLTSRDAAPDLDRDLDVLLADLGRSPAVTRVPLTGLTSHEVAALIGGDPLGAEAIVTETGGNPLLVEHVTGGHRGSLTALMSRREELLDDDAGALLDLAATFGSEFDADLLAVGSGAPILSVLESLEQAERAGLIVSRPGHRGRFGFVHALFRTHRYQALSSRRRLEAHAAVAAALASRPDDDGLLSERAATRACPCPSATLARRWSSPARPPTSPNSSMPTTKR